MQQLTKQKLIDIFKPNYKIKIKSNLYRNFNFTITHCAWDNIKKSRFVFETTLEKKSERFDISNNIIQLLKDFENDYPLFVYIKEKFILLPIISYEYDDENKILWLIIN